MTKLSSIAVVKNMIHDKLELELDSRLFQVDSYNILLLAIGCGFFFYLFCSGMHRLVMNKSEVLCWLWILD